MKLAHTDMGITKADYAAFMRCLSVTPDTFKCPSRSAAKWLPSHSAWNQKSPKRSDPLALGHAFDRLPSDAG